MSIWLKGFKMLLSLKGCLHRELFCPDEATAEINDAVSDLKGVTDTTDDSSCSGDEQRYVTPDR